MKDKVINDLLKRISDLEFEVEKQEQRIDKAIEYINNHQLVFELSSKKQIAYWFDMFYKELLEILKGSDKK